MVSYQPGERRQDQGGRYATKNYMVDSAFQYPAIAVMVLSYSATCLGHDRRMDSRLQQSPPAPSKEFEVL